jgi:hypothetical protein
VAREHAAGTMGGGVGRDFVGGFSRRSILYGGVTFLLFPIWYPLAEEGRLRWPRVEDIPLYAFAMAMGAAFVLWARFKD